jgi:glycosyltransferase involved in cell wall biosynthesis
MACNLPIVSVEVGDVPERLRGVSACSINPRDPVLLGKALAEVIRGCGRSNGRSALVRDELDLPSVARRVIEVYERVLLERRMPEPIETAHSLTRKAAR